MSTATATESAEVTTDETAPVETAEPSKPVLASLDKANPLTQMAVPLVNASIEAANAIVTKNMASSKTEAEILETLRDTSTNDKAVALRAKRDEIIAQLDKVLADEAKALKAEAGEPDTEAEKAALKQVKDALSVLASTPDGDKVSHFLKDLVKSVTPRKVGGTSNAGPKRDLSAVREWAKKNGHEVGDRGRIHADILEAYTKATGNAIPEA